MAAQRMPHRKYAHFRDDQIVFLITHSGTEITSNQLENLSGRIKEFLGGGTISWPLSQRFSFPRPTDSELEQQAKIINELKDYFRENQREYNPSDYESNLFDEQNLSDPLKPPKLGFSIIVGNIDFENSDVQEKFDPSELIELIRNLRGRIGSLSDQEFTVKSVSPNWLMGNASQGGSTGGPGGLPKPFKGKDEDGGMRAGFDIKEKLGTDLYGAGENVDVVILDTAPCPHDLVIAHKEGKDNPLIQTLLGPDGKLHVYWASYDQLLRMYNTSFNSHDYRMSDHGLFAAGIIHSIVPQATIHLIEVLNPHGVGDLLTLAEGFHTVFHKIYKEAGPERTLIVNCSLMLELPLEEDHCYADEMKVKAKDKEPPDNVDDVTFEQDVLQQLVDPEDQDTVLEINELCKRLFGVGRQVVAAAGNDWENGKARRRRRTPGNKPPDEPRENAPRARYPAAFASVVGVGALPRNSEVAPNIHKTSTFSNLGDKPSGDGIMTLGGEEGDTEGVLGLYLGEKFPRRLHINSDNDKNKITMIERKLDKDENNYWAWWSGTSFATPIVTGTIAAALSSKLPDGTYQFANTQQVVRALYNAGVILEEQTEAQEDVMDVKQEKPLPI